MAEEQPIKKEVGVESGEKKPSPDVESAAEEMTGEAERQKSNINVTGEEISNIAKDENLPPAETGEILMENKDIQDQAGETVGEFERGVETTIQDTAEDQQESDEGSKVFEDLGEEMKAGEKEYKDETEKRLKEWEEKSDEEKKKEIEDFTREKLESDPAVKEIMNDNEKLQEYIKNISEERKKLLEAKSEAAKKIEELLKGEVDFLKLRPEDRMAAKEVLGELLKSSRLSLSFEKADYCLEKIESMENLMKNHESREINIEALEGMIKMAEDAEAYLAQFEKLTEMEKKEAEEEIEGLIDKLIEIYRKNPRLYQALAGTVVLGVIVLAFAMGVGHVSELIKLASPGIAEKAIEYAPYALGVGGLAALYKFKKTRPAVEWAGRTAWGGAKGSAKLAIYGPLALGAMCVSYLSKGENWDKGIEFITGVKVHRWVKSVPEKGK